MLKYKVTLEVKNTLTYTIIADDADSAISVAIDLANKSNDECDFVDIEEV